MADKDPNFEVLSRNEIAGWDYRILVRAAQDRFALVAPHGGGIEEGTSEIANAIAGEEFPTYAFEGLKLSANAGLHITSTRFDEPMCFVVVGRSTVIVTIHGDDRDGAGAAVFLGGLDDEFGHLIGVALEARGFAVRRHSNPRLQGREPENLCNRGTPGKGVQLDVSRALRRKVFASLSREGRKSTTAQFHDFVDAVRGVLVGASGYPCSQPSDTIGG